MNTKIVKGRSWRRNLEVGSFKKKKKIGKVLFQELEGYDRIVPEMN